MNPKKKLASWLDRIPGATYIFLVVFVAASVLVPRFFSVGNLSTMLLQACTLTLLSVAMALTLMMGSIDLSMGGVVSMSGVIMAFLMRDGCSAWVALPVGLLIGAVFGTFNGLMVTKLKIPAFIATFGSMGIAQSIANTISQERTVSWEAGPKTSLIDFLGNHAFSIEMGADASQTLSISNLLIITVIVVAVVWVLFRRTTLGSNIYALGANEETARLSGINVTKWRIIVFIISGLLAALGGIIVMVRSNSVQPTIGANMEFQACVAAVLGGNMMEGGRGSVPGAVLGALTLYTIRSAMSLLGIDTSWVQVVIGCVLVVGMLLNNAAAAREKAASSAALKRARLDRSAREEGATK
ncbi:MAG: ABC transporter permease [Clostridiales bacterium]|nr:ABC transporter permease [Clostridiales bacterium]